MRVCRSERLAALGTRGETGGDLDAIGKLLEALQMRLERHAQADDGDAVLAHPACWLPFVLP
jgi:hypothetical protein